MNPRDAYPKLAGFKAVRPSEEAAEAISGAAKTLRDELYRVIAGPPQGLTADEVADRLNKPILSIRPRASELYRQGEIRWLAGARGKNNSGMMASKWVKSPPLSGPEPAETQP